MERRVLYIQPVGSEGPALIEETRPRGTHAEICRPVIGHPIPKAAQGYAAIVALGGPMGVYETDKHPWMADLITLLRDALEKNVPTLGICLGSQALAAAGGAEVRPTGLQEIGWFPITFTGEAQEDPLLGMLPSPLEVFHWHGDRWELPEGAVLLASSERCDHQAFRLGERAWGLQFHMEITPEIPPIWAEAYLDELMSHPELPGPARIAEQSRDLGPKLEPLARKTFERFWEIALNAL
jgi:GMP synthase-like glutamine amidotransferase